MNASPADIRARIGWQRDQSRPWRERGIATLWLASLSLPLGWATNAAALPMFTSVLSLWALLQAWSVLLQRSGLLVEHADPMRTAVVAVLLALLLPDGTPLWQQMLTASVGTLFAEGLFGGRGHAFLHPVAVALAFHVMSWDTTLAGAWATVPLLALVPGAVLLGVLGLVPPGTLGGVALVLAAAALSPFAIDASAAPLVVLVALYLVADPASGATLRIARVLHGALFALLASVLFDASAPLAPMVQAALLASLAAPLIDRLVLRRRLSGPAHG